MNSFIHRLSIGIVFFLTGILIHRYPIVSNTLFLSSYLLISYDVFLEAFQTILKGEIFDEKFLMVIATIGALLLKEFPEACAIMLFYQIGEYLEAFAVGKSRNRISSLASLKSEQATRVSGEILPISKIQIGDLLLVRPGEKIPLDGIVTDGKSSLDTSMITGESLPKEVFEGEKILSGCLNLTGVLTIRVTSDESTSTVTKILELVEGADRETTKSERFITKFARVYTPIVVVLALFICLIPIAFGGNFHLWFRRALVFLTASCPCALVICVPLGFMNGLGALTKHGILLKGTSYFEVLKNAKKIVFDKTGTLTKGELFVQEVHPVDLKEEEFLRYVASAEMYSIHPIAQAIRKLRCKKISKKELTDYQEIAGKGVSIFYKGKRILVGTFEYLTENGITLKKVEESGIILYVSYGKKYLGYLILNDEVREEAKASLNSLKMLGVSDFCILSGDSASNVAKVAQTLNVSEYYANLLPQDKVKKLKEYQKTSSPVLFVGDGMNDAPVLLHSDLGISMGSLNDAAIESSGMILMEENLLKLPVALYIARKTYQVVMQSVFFAIFVKLIVLVLGAFGLANIWHAVFADVGVTILVILYSFSISFIHYE